MLRAARQSIKPASGLLVILAIGLAGCAPGAAIDQLPSNMGLPAGAPARPATAYDYPAVHDMPPPRSTTPISEAEQIKLEKELLAARDRQESHTGPAKKAATIPKNKPADAESGQTAGAKTSGAKTNP